MSDRVDAASPVPGETGASNPPADERPTGWIVPENAVTASLWATRDEENTSEVPFPIDAVPERAGGWYVPPEATERVAGIIAERMPRPAPRPAVDLASLLDSVETTEAPDTAETPEAPGTTSLAPAIESDYSWYVVDSAAVAAGAESVPAEAVAEPATEAASEEPAPEPAPAIMVYPMSIAIERAPTPEPVPAQGETTPDEAAEVGEPEAVGAAPVAAEGIAAAAAEASPVAEPAPAEPAAPAVVDPGQRFVEVERAVAALRRRYAAGGMTRDQLKEELRRLMILDENQQWWMVGLETDRWYKYDGKEWLLATPPGRPAPEAVASGTGDGTPAQTRFGAAIDDKEPLPQRVPLQDEGATLVGQWASRLESEARGTRSEAFDGGVTVPSHSLDVTQPSSAIPDWQARLAAAANAVDAGLTVPSAAVRAEVAGGAAVPSPVPAVQRPLQPDYGLKPGGLLVNRQDYGGCLIRLALVSAFVVLGGAVLAVILAVLGYASIIGRYENRIAALASTVAAESQSVRFFDASGRQIYQLNDPNLGARRAIPLEEISPYMILSTIATENERFYSDPGFDVIAIARAILQNLRAGGIASGASTITQQIARAHVLDPGAANDRSVARKIDEIIASSEIARRYNKSEILEYYLNTVYFGNLAYGVEAAAQTYFGISARDLNLAQASFLAGMIQAPALYDPSIRPPAGQEAPSIVRARQVRTLMARLGCIQMEHEPFASTGPFCVSQADIESAQTVVQIAQMEAAMATYRPAPVQITYPHFVVYVRQLLEEMFGQDALYRSGFNVYTTIDPRIQDLAEQAVRTQIASLRAQRVTNGAVLAIRPTDGAILAMVGSADFYNRDIDGQVNVTLAARQPGSAIKPFVYLAAFERDAENRYWTPATIIWDVQSCFGTQPPYCPTNYDNRFHGPHSARSALANSYNVPAVKTLAYVGIGRFRAVADRLGISFPLTPLEQAGLTAALGGAEVRMFDLVRAYAVLGNGGQSVEPFAIARITRTSEGREETVYEHPVPPTNQQVEPGLAYLISSILSDNAARTPAFGASGPLVVGGHTVAVKTGTTNNNRDNWTIGYTPSIAVGVWVGNSDGSPMVGTSGLTGAAPIWNAVMSGALAGTARSEFPVPPTVQQIEICADFGSQVFPECQNRRPELFLAANPPPAPDQVVRTLPIDGFTGLIANENCPDFVEYRTFLVTDDLTAPNWLNTTPEGQQWAQSRNLQLPISAPPTGSCQPGMPRPIIRISNPGPNEAIQGLREIIGVVYAPGFNYEIQVGQGQPAAQFFTVDGPFGSQNATTDAFLGRWNTLSVPNGPYMLKLRVFDQQGRSIEVTSPVVVNNGAPLPPTTQTEPTPFFPPPDPGLAPSETPIVIQPFPGEATPVFPWEVTPTPFSIFPPTQSP
jgi:membrane peptidoglycan carboxypeptidase